MKAAFVCILGLLALVSVAQVRSANPQSPDKAAAVKGNNTFAFDLYGKLRAHDGDLFFSPASISTALAMTYAGARGQTAEEMAQTLHFTRDQQQLHSALCALLHDLNGDGKKRGHQLSVANALWAQQGHPFLADFLKLTRENYGASLQEVDFAGSTEQARRTINTWVEKQTQDKIKELLQAGVLTSDTRLVLTNAIYFKGDWNVPFKKEATRDGPFQVAGKDKVTVPLMNQTGNFNYLDGNTFQALELPYVGKDLSMVVLLPKKVDGLADFEKSLTADKLAGWLGKLAEEEVVVTLPKFKATSELSLKDTLTGLGMVQAFSDAADFSGLDGKKDLSLSAVVHKAYVDVNEEGTEAAAATGVVVKTLAIRASAIFRADHPFVFVIRDRKTDSILFLGRLSNPEK
jgi:serpin B